MSKKQLSYSESISKIRSLIDEIDQLDGDLDRMMKLVRQVHQLIIDCENRIQSAEMEVRDLFEEEE